MLKIARFPGILSISAILVLLVACGGGSDSPGQNKGAETGAAQIEIHPLPDEVVDAFCGLTRYSRESELVALLGEPDERVDGEDMVMLRWLKPRWSADAMWSNGKISIAGANARQDDVRKRKRFPGYEAWVVGRDGNTLKEMQSELGEGVLIGIRWYSGVEVARSLRRAPSFDPAMAEDRCSPLYAWPSADGQNYGVAQFRSDGFLKGII